MKHISLIVLSTLSIGSAFANSAPKQNGCVTDQIEQVISEYEHDGAVMYLQVAGSEYEHDGAVMHPKVLASEYEHDGAVMHQKRMVGKYEHDGAVMHSKFTLIEYEHDGAVPVGREIPRQIDSSQLNIAHLKK